MDLIGLEKHDFMTKRITSSGNQLKITISPKDKWKKGDKILCINLEEDGRKSR